MPRPLRILVLTPKPKGVSPGQRFRLEQWAPHLAAKHDVELVFDPFESPGLTQVLYEKGHYSEKALRILADFVRRSGSVVRSRRFDAVVVYREASLIGPAIHERLVRALGVPLLFDFDDTIWLSSQPSDVNGIFSRLHFWGKTATTCRLSDAVVVGNEFLADYARQHTSRVFVVPTTIELGDYPLQPELPLDDAFVVVWSGSTHTIRHLETARGALERFARMCNLTVKVVCNRPLAKPIAGANNVFVPWSEQTEVAAIGASHVGLMPLPDDVFTKGKCGLKALQYMATGCPVVISPVGMNTTLVQHGENGLLASSEDEWVSALERLRGDGGLRRAFRERGRRTVEAGFAAEHGAAGFAHAVRAATG